MATNVPSYIRQGVTEFEASTFHELVRGLQAGSMIAVNFYDRLGPVCYKTTTAFNEIANNPIYFQAAVGFFSINVAKGNIDMLLEGLGIRNLPVVAFFTTAEDRPQGVRKATADGTETKDANFTIPSASPGRKRAEGDEREEFTFRRTHHHREVLKYQPRNHHTRAQTPLTIDDVIANIKATILSTSKTTFRDYCRVGYGREMTLVEIL